MSLPFLSPSRTVLLVGDEALYIYNVSFNAARLVDTVPWQADSFEETVIGLIRKECGGKPVLILNDMTDQHFKGGQRMPKVGPMDKANVLERKLQVAFPSYPIRGALAVKPPKGIAVSAAEKKQGGLYLFAAVPMSEPIAKTMSAVKKSLSSVAGFFLLPIEVSDMVKKLAEALAGKSRKPSRWVVFIGQHHNGALRQVITRDGQLAMTRMTPVTDTDTDHEIWAQEVFQEFKATVSYLSRFGFVPDDGVDVIVVCNPAAGTVLEKLIDIPCHYSTFTAPEAARELGINIGQQDDPRYADALHAAWVGRKSRFILPMQAKELAKVHKPRQVAAMAMFLMLLGGGYQGWVLFNEMQKTSEANEGIETQQRSLTQATAAYEAQVAKMSALGFDVKLVQGSIKTFNDIEARRLHELTVVQKIHQALGDSLRLDTLSIDYQEPKADSRIPQSPDAPPPKPEMKAAIKLSFPPTIEPEFGVKEVNNLRTRLLAALPGCTVNILKNVADFTYKDTYKGETGSENKAPDKQYYAELEIEGTI